MPAPKNISFLQSFLGLANYYNVFVPNRHSLLALLNKLLKKTLNGFGRQSARKHLKKIEGMLTFELFLIYYDPKTEIIVENDTSLYGIGACNMDKLKEGSIKPVAHASRTLLPDEKNYFVIEKESLGIVFSLKKFHKFIHKRRFTLLTDHRPLLAILGSKKGLPTH